MEFEYFDDNQMDNDPEYDLGFNTTYGPNTVDMPLSPPGTPPPPEHDFPPRRELSPFSNGSSMTSVDSQDSVGMSYLAAYMVTIANLPLGYYREESGRMFAAMPGVPVVFPVDHAEIRRVSEQHELLKLVCSGNFMGSVSELLGPEHPHLRVLDVVSNSPWVDEMAEDFPHVKFQGCNFVPTRHPYLENVQFEVYNLDDGFRGKDASFDLIHCRSAFKATRNFKAWLIEFQRLLKPGGMLIIADLEISIWLRDGRDVKMHLPALMGFVDYTTSSLLSQGIDLTQMGLSGQWLREMGGWDDVDDTVTSIPVGDWDSDHHQKEIGNLARDNIMSVLYSVQPLARRMGKTPEEFDRLVQAAREELYDHNEELFERLFYCVARKRPLGP